MRLSPFTRCLGAVFLLSCAAAPAPGQDYGQQPSPVRYTEAINKPVAQTVQLPGYLEAPNVSVLAGEISGLVTELKVREGERVTTGQPLVMLRTTPLQLSLQAAQARLKEAQARSKLAGTRLERYRGLIEGNAISRQELDEARYEFDAWEGRIETLLAEIASIRFDIERSTIRAPFNGVVVARHTEVGQWSEAGSRVLEVLSTDTQEVHVDVPEKYFNGLKSGVNVNVTFDSMPGREFTAYIRAIIPRADPRARTFPVKLRLREPSTEIGAGMIARAVFPIGESVPGTLVPKDAIVRLGDNTMVFLIDQGSAVPAPVTVGGAMGVWSVVNGAVAPGDKVITRGNERLQPGQPVQAELLPYPSP
ncbi:MAG: efflux RND transporter periplasmic adaptor subunit [Gammaproteobacteria bacterium]|nr:efflux RND transporter periplasmic adaptor subunit [Gammaproteobacteria bacterium]